MQISEKFNIIIEKHHYYELLNKKLLKDAETADYSGWSQSDCDTALFSSATTTSKNIDLINSWVKLLIFKNYPFLGDEKYMGESGFTMQTWFVKYREGDETKSHHHIPSFCSWVYFLRCPKGSPPLVFTQSRKKVKSEEGKVVIFPSWLRHHVPPNKCDGRVVLVGNVFNYKKDR
tara:strand:+ start:210 stop:734 length:525 start_codon:yes stop_codon:yes gene_type:complete